MVSPVDAVRYGMGLDQTGRWHDANPRLIPAKRGIGEEDLLSPARGAICGLLASAVFWFGLFEAGHALLGLF